MSSNAQLSHPTFSAAAVASARVHPHLLRNVRSGVSPKPAVPDVESIQAILNAAFWASLRREEGYQPRISLAFVSPDQVRRPLRFERPLQLLPQVLTKVAPAVERPGIHLGVRQNGDGLEVWGATRNLPPYSFVLEVVQAGLLVIKQGREEGSGKFVNVAVIEGDEIKVIDEQAATLPDCPGLLTSLLGLESQFSSVESSSVLVQLAVSMRAHGRGGALLVVPHGSSSWEASILRPITYSVAPAYTRLAELLDEEPSGEQVLPWKDAVRRVIDGIAGSTAVDGATVMTDRYELLAFGAKIVQRDSSGPVPRATVTEPIEGIQSRVVEPAHIGGTRHLSAAQFVYDQRDAIAMVASQDGRFTVFGWSPCIDMVQAHRIESLLL